MSGDNQANRSPRQKVVGGDRAGNVLKSVDTVNFLLAGAELATAAANKQSVPDQPLYQDEPDIVEVLNSTGDDIERGDAIDISTPLIAQNKRLESWWQTRGFVGARPQAYSVASLGRVAIAAEPIRKGAIGRAYASGVCKAKIDIKDTNHEYADVDPVAGGFRLISRSGGSSLVQILEVDSDQTSSPPTTGVLWATVRLQNGTGVHFVGKTLDAITGMDCATSCPSDGRLQIYYLHPSTRCLTILLDRAGKPVQIRAWTLRGCTIPVGVWCVPHCDRFGEWWVEYDPPTHAQATLVSDMCPATGGSGGSGSGASVAITGVVFHDCGACGAVPPTSAVNTLSRGACAGDTVFIRFRAATQDWAVYAVTGHAVEMQTDLRLQANSCTVDERRATLVVEGCGAGVCSEAAWTTWKQLTTIDIPTGITVAASGSGDACGLALKSKQACVLGTISTGAETTGAIGVIGRWVAPLFSLAEAANNCLSGLVRSICVLAAGDSDVVPVICGDDCEDGGGSGGSGGGGGGVGSCDTTPTLAVTCSSDSIATYLHVDTTNPPTNATNARLVIRDPFGVVVLTSTTIGTDGDLVDVIGGAGRVWDLGAGYTATVTWLDADGATMCSATATFENVAA